MKEQILDILKKENKALSVYEINDLLGLSSSDELKELLKNLEDLINDLKVYHTNKDKYLLFENSHLKTGRLVVNKKGYGFVDIEGDEDVYIASKNLNGAIHGDLVVVEITSKKGLDLEGRILKIIKRELKTVVGTIIKVDNKLKLKIDDDKININIILEKDSLKNVVEGNKVVASVLSRIDNHNFKGEIIKIIGHINDPGVDILSIAAKHDINDAFSEEVINEVEALPNEVLESEYVGRTDLRSQMIFTIDGDDTKDIDDAISLRKLETGNYELGVHIADVSHYVKNDSALDKEAYERGTSVYLADRVIPMLPHKLSNGICSLNPNVDRLTISCVMEIDAAGEVVNYDIFESVIKSNIQMTYKKVNKILEENIIPEGYEKYADTLKEMKILADILRKNKIEKGYIDFDLDESKIIVNEKGEAIDVSLRNRGAGEKLIEDFMIAANETVARHIFYMDYPFIYRVHGEPNEEKITKFLHYVSILGYSITGKINKITPKAMQQILEQLKGVKEYSMLSSQLLRSMQKAIYDTKNIGHFGLASKCYTHFTSPIRRYPDTTVHRLLHIYLFNKNLNIDTVRYWENRLPFIAEHSSLKERNSIECEREVDDIKKAEYMEKHIGEKFEGVISGVMSFGIFVELPNLIEGLVRVEDMKGDFYTYDESTFSLIGKKNKRGYRLGDDISVIVKSASKEKHTIDFVIDNSTVK